jgi:hypothetical protein
MLMVMTMIAPTLATFAAAVRLAVAQLGSSSSERFGHRKVFVSAVFGLLAGAGLGMSLEGFKAQLFAARRAGLLELARADLVAAMPGAVVAASRILDGNAEYHFVVDSSAMEPWQTTERIPVERMAGLSQRAIDAPPAPGPSEATIAESRTVTRRLDGAAAATERRAA